MLPISTNISNLCTSTDVNTLISNWDKYSCSAILRAFLNTKPDGTVGYNKNNLPQVKSIINSAFGTFYNSNQASTNTKFANQILSTCLDPGLPNGCQTFIEDICSGNSSILNTLAPYYCGCQTSAALQNSCEPSCHSANVVQNANTNTGTLITCNPTVCIISDTYIAEVNTNIGKVNITNICPSCSVNTPCDCTIESTDISQTLTDLGIVNIKQYCGSNSNCQIVNKNSDGTTTTTQVPCDSISSTINFTDYSYIPNWIVLLFLLLIAIIAIIFWFLEPGKHK